MEKFYEGNIRDVQYIKDKVIIELKSKGIPIQCFSTVSSLEGEQNIMKKKLKQLVKFVNKFTKAWTMIKKLGKGLVLLFISIKKIFS